MSILRSMSMCLQGTPELQPPLEARGGRLRHLSRRCHRQALCGRNISRPRRKNASKPWCINLLAAFEARIDQLDWMAPQTKLVAKAKLKALKIGVGYPDHWRSYEDLKITRGDAFGNWSRADLYAYRRQLAKLGQAVDRSEWVMNAQLVNAVNLPAMNALNFPAALLQPPYFDPDQPPVMNYGAVGATIGHEISHSFDDQGALFDPQGRLRNWWRPDDFAHFRASGARLAAQFDGYQPFPDLHLNGEQTLSENIADVAGLERRLRCLSARRPEHACREAGGVRCRSVVLFEFRAKLAHQDARCLPCAQQVITDGHAPAQYRASTVRNLDAWYAAFAVKPGEKLYLAPQDRVRVW